MMPFDKLCSRIGLEECTSISVDPTMKWWVTLNDSKHENIDFIESLSTSDMLLWNSILMLNITLI
jgi:hypothetical protein